MALSINEIKSGATLLVDGDVWVALECQHVKPGKGAAFVRVKMRNLKNNSVQERTFRGDEKVDCCGLSHITREDQYVTEKRARKCITTRERFRKNTKNV